MYYILFKNGSDTISSEIIEDESVMACMPIENYKSDYIYTLIDGELVSTKRTMFYQGNDTDEAIESPLRDMALTIINKI